LHYPTDDAVTLRATLGNHRSKSTVEIVDRVHLVVSDSQRDDTAILALTAKPAP